MVIQRPFLTPAACSMCCGDVERDVSGSRSTCTHCGDQRVAADRLAPRARAPVFTAGARPPALTASPGLLRYGPGGFLNE
jgi:hypothetical protein